MRLVELAALYLLIGVGSGAAAALRPTDPAKRWLDATLMVAFWPLCAPFLLLRAPEPGGATRSEIAFLLALRRAAGTPLATLLPDETTARALGRRLRVAAGKLREIEELLRRPEFDDSSATGVRLQNIQRLKRLRDRFARELVELEELLAQLTTQAEVVRLAGAPDSETRDLVNEILSRVEGLDAVLDEEPRRLDSLAETR
jgi:hypothetical protein